MCLSRRDPRHQPVKRRPRRHHRRRVRHSVLGGEDLHSPAAQPVHGTRRALSLFRDRPADSIHHPLIDPACRPGPPGEPVINQPPHALGLIPAPRPLQRPQRHGTAGFPQLRRLGDLPLPQRGDRRVVLSPRNRIQAGISGQPADHLGHVAFQPPRLLSHLGGQALQQPLRRQRSPAARTHHGEVRIGEQVRQRHRRLQAAQIGNPRRQPGDRAHLAAEAHLVTSGQHRRPRHAHRPPPPAADHRLPAQRGRRQVGDQHPGPQQVIQHRQHAERIARGSRARQQRGRAGENLPQPGRLPPVQAPRMPVTGQPAHIGSKHRVQHPGPPVAPAHTFARTGRHLEDLRVPRRNLVISADIDHHCRPVGQPGEVVRGMPAGLPGPRPRQPEGLRGERHHLRIKVEHHRVVAFQPRFMADMPACCRRPPPAREVPLPGRPAERADRSRVLEPHIPAASQPLTATRPSGIDELRHSPRSQRRSCRSRQRRTHRHTHLKHDRTDRTTAPYDRYAR